MQPVNKSKAYLCWNWMFDKKWRIINTNRRKQNKLRCGKFKALITPVFHTVLQKWKRFLAKISSLRKVAKYNLEQKHGLLKE